VQIPNAETIEGAVDSLLRLDPVVRNDELGELHEAIGADAARRLGLKITLPTEFEQGYLLGVETARRMVAGSAEVLMHGSDPAKIL
jgi:hypothetical protein